MPSRLYVVLTWINAGRSLAQRAVRRTQPWRHLQIPLRAPHPTYHCASRVPNKLDPFKSALTTRRGAFFVSIQRPRAAFILLCSKPILCSLDDPTTNERSQSTGRHCNPESTGNAPNLILTGWLLRTTDASVRRWMVRVRRHSTFSVTALPAPPCH